MPSWGKTSEMKRDSKHVQSRLAFMCLERSQAKKSPGVIFNSLKNVRLSQLTHCSNSGGCGEGRHVEASATLSSTRFARFRLFTAVVTGNRLLNTCNDANVS